MTGHDDADAALDNCVWAALGTRHAAFAEADGAARRYAPDVSIFAAVDEPTPEAWRDLGRLNQGAKFVCLFRRHVPDPPEGWKVLFHTTCHQMVCDALVAPPDGAADEIVELGTDRVPAMLELVELTKPGPFEQRTIELGRYLGVVRDDRLVAMAGERMKVAGHTEVSAVCTHPDGQGRGLGARLTHAVAAGIIERGERPFLHVAVENHTARRVYERLGFTTRAMVDVFVARPPAR